jgi:adhesin/invasin
VTVTFTDNGAGGTFGTPSGATGSTGTLSSTYTPAVVTKITTVTITASATGYTSATFTETVNPAPVQALAATSGSGQTGTVGVAFPTALVVTATSNGTAQSGVTVSFTDGQGGTFNPASGTTGSTGQISTVYTPQKSGTLTVTASATGYTSATFTETANAPVQTLTATSGGGQTGTVGSPLASPLVVTATSNSSPVSGLTVSFTDGNGGLFSPASGTTGSNGQISTTYTPEVSGTLTVTASATGYTSAIFTETVNAAAGNILSVTSGNNQSGGTGTKLPSLLVITATSNGVAVKGLKVTFTDNGGTLSPTQAVTNSSGEASTSYTLPGTAGTYTVTASATGYTSAIFTETATTVTVSTISLVSGGKQKGTVGTTLANPIVFEAKSSSGSPVSGASITFSSASGGTFNPSTAVTGANGEASTEYTLPDKPEVITVTAADGSVSAVTTEQSLAGPPADLTIVSGNKQSCTEGNALPKPLVVLVTDEFDNGLGGVTVNFTDNGAGGTFSSSGSVTTSSNGQASVTYTCGKTAETVTVSATTSTLGPLNFTETVAK